MRTDAIVHRAPNLSAPLLLLSVRLNPQDANAVIKRRLQELMPLVKVFLDIENLDDIALLPKHIASSR